MFIDLTVEEEVERGEELMRDQVESESESEVSSVMDVSSEEEGEISPENSGMMHDYGLLMNSSRRIVSGRKSGSNASGAFD